ncbi:hypothetical protein OMP38_25005 [Cohnella ginsengisoli]|uniref:Uncharacterized protein n=1 Tax=Cohnella ginsengisoli TaxID=425004 RepID=A0A9X4KK41_9BACL|nr:hypothetical protein [Cohnella ginsengisoli]MDG0793724.1 hypothetical protein [Cohnella ginsengisoli]
MRHYFKLLALEVRRFRWIMVGMMLYTLVVECAAVAIDIHNFANRYGIKEGTREPGVVPQSYSFADVIGNTQGGFALGIFIPVAVLVAYVLVIWYRDWFGRHPFAFRQLMLPGGRIPLYFAKLTAIFLFVFSMLALQLVAMAILKLEYAMVTPELLKEPSRFTDAMYASEIFKLLLPLHFSQFLTNYGMGFLGVLLVFAGILLERSYRIRGIVLAALYLALNITLLVLASMSNELSLYPSETIAVCLTIFGLEVAGAIWLSLKLITRKISA